MDSIILLGGSGTRLNAGTNKILLPLNNLPLFLYSYNKLKKISKKVILVIRKEDEEYISCLLYTSDAADELVIV